MILKSGLLAFSIILAFSAGAARADGCTKPVESGTWVHPSPKTNMLSSLEIEHFCTPDRRFGNWKIRAKSRCYPRDCTWGWSPGQRATRSSLYAGFQGFYSIRYLTMRVFGDRMEVRVEIVYNDEKRQDETYSVTLARD